MDKKREKPAPMPIPGVKRVLGVVSGKGGVGKSTVAVALAQAMAKMGHKVGLLDADIYGPSVPTLLGVAGQRAVTEGKRFLPIEVGALRMQSIAGLVAEDDALIWRGPMASRAVSQLAYQTLWRDLDYLIIDLPPGTGDIALTITQQLPLTAALLVSIPHALSLADMTRCHKMLQKMNIPILGLVQNMAYLRSDRTGEELFPWSHGGLDGAAALATWAASVSLDVLASLPFGVQQFGDPLWEGLAGRIVAGLSYLPTALELGQARGGS